MPASLVTSSATGNALLAALDGGSQWSGEITYNRVDPLVPAELQRFSSNLPTQYQTAGLGLTDAMWGQVTDALQVLRFYAAFSWAVSDAADANYVVSDFTRPDNVNVAGIASMPGNGPIVALNRSTWDASYTEPLQFWIVLHELAHTLGLQHVSGLPSVLNHSAYTVMSYNWTDLGDDTGFGLPWTPMALDVAVLQAKYGPASNNSGATQYALTRFLLDLAGADGLVQNGGGYVCIWDSGGFDTLTYNGSTGAMLNLNAATLSTAALSGDLADVIGDVAATSRIFARFGSQAQAEIVDPARSAGGFFSSLLTSTGREVGGYTIANGAAIEGATGGSGDDLLIGNGLANALQGAAGHDDLYGGSGDDSLDGGAGDDRVFGGLGGDTLQDSGGGSNYLRGDEGSDSLVGGSGFDDINGNMGDDTASGGLGDDWVVGGRDNDRLFGDLGADLVYGNLGADTCDGGEGDDIVRGGQQDDVLFGGAGNDFLSGDRDNDTITGGAGADIFHSHGEAGIDRVLDFNRLEGDRVLLLSGTTYTVDQVGADVIIRMNGGGQLILAGVSVASLTGDWITA